MDRKVAAQLTTSLKKTHHLLSSSMSGWLYAGFVDGHFNCDTWALPSAEVEPVAPTHKLEIHETPLNLIAEVAAISDPQAQLNRLSQLSRTPYRALFQDSFPDRSGLRATYEAEAEQKALRILILGAGPIGLALASALKVAYAGAVSVVVVETRCLQPGIKAPYTRHWVTNIPKASVRELVEPRLNAIFENVGDETYIGVPIDVFETLLWASCKDLGVLFYCEPKPDLGAFEAVDLVFDATGGRLQSLDFPNELKPPKIPGTTHTLPERYGVGYDQFAVNAKAMTTKINIKVIEANGQKLPLLNNQPLCIPMMKLSEIPMTAFAALMTYVRSHNEDNKFYLWPGKLKAEINEALLLINLTLAEYCVLIDKLPPRQILATAHLPSTDLDERLLTVFKMMQAVPRVMIERPFSYRPYFRDRYDATLMGLSVIPMGDSIYNGHPKVGNGMGSHLGHISHVLSKIRNVLPSP